MKVILYMAVSANGMIARGDGNSDWVSTEDVDSFQRVCRSNDAVIMGRRTYDVLQPNNLPSEKGINLVLTKNERGSLPDARVEFANMPPAEALAHLAKKGCRSVCVIGGSITATDFLKAKLIDEVYLDIEPLLIGDGMPLIKAAPVELHLELLDTKKLNKSTVQLRYRVLK